MLVTSTEPQYITKDSGKRQQFDSGGQRDTQEGKPRFDLLFPKGVPYEDQLITRWAYLMGRGAEKYTERNWELFDGQEELDRAKSSALRHLMQLIHEVDDEEDHAAAVMFNVLVIENIKRKLSEDKKDVDMSHDIWDTAFEAGQELGYEEGYDDAREEFFDEDILSQ